MKLLKPILVVVTLLSPPHRNPWSWPQMRSYQQTSTACEKICFSELHFSPHPDHSFGRVGIRTTEVLPQRSPLRYGYQMPFENITGLLVCGWASPTEKKRARTQMRNLKSSRKLQICKDGATKTGSRRAVRRPWGGIVLTLFDLSFGAEAGSAKKNMILMGSGAKRAVE